MRLKKLYMLLLCLILGHIVAFAQAGSTSIEMDAYSRYIWRDGIGDFSVLQPSIDYSFTNSGLNLNLWLSINSGNEVDFDPVDASTTLYYNWAFDNAVELNAGIVHYSGYYSGYSFLTLPIRNWTELYTSFAAYDFVFSPTLEFYFNDIEGLYNTLGLEHSFEWKKLTLNTSMLIGYRVANVDGYNGWREVGISMGVPFSIKSFEFELSLTHVQFPTQYTSRTYVGLNISFP